MTVSSRVRAWISGWLTIGGLAGIGYGVLYWWRGFPFPVVMLAVYSDLGFLAIGLGASLRQPATRLSLGAATASFAVSTLLTLGLFWLPPFQPGAILLFGLALAGALISLARFRRLDTRR